MEWSKRWFVLLVMVAFAGAEGAVQAARAGVQVRGPVSEVNTGDVATGADDAKDEKSDGTTASDDFDDNFRDEQWGLIADDLSSCWLEETNRRLELRATSKASRCTAYYVARSWRLYPTADFTFRFDFHYDLCSDEAGWVSVLLTPDVDSDDPLYMEFGAGCDNDEPRFWYQAGDTAKIAADVAYRGKDDGTLYVSYDAAADELYLSDIGYGDDNALWTLRSVLGTSWGGWPIVLSLGGGADRLDIRSGSAYVDNFVMSARGTADGLSDVYRFWAPDLGSHFYTIDERERDELIKEYPDVWVFEGVDFRGASAPFLAGMKPVYRFWSECLCNHFYTISETERLDIEKRYPDVWALEGVAFYAYPEGAQPDDAAPVYRFWNRVNNAHFYTASEAERDNTLKRYSDTYVFEGVAFYAYLP
jgi:hypothetical protein